MSSLSPIGISNAFEIPLTRAQRAQKLVEEGQTQILRGEYNQAIESCSRALTVRDDWAPAYLCRGEARMMVRDEHAGKDAQSAARLDPKSGAPFRLLGILDYRTGRYSSALMNFNQALTHSKLKTEEVSDIYYLRAQIHFNQGSLAEALKSVNKGLGVAQGVNGDFGNWTYYSLRAEIFRHQEKEALADQDERQVLKLINERMQRRPEERTELLAKLAESYFLLREYDQAAAAYGEILDYDKDNVDILLRRAQVHHTAENYDPALKDLNRVLNLDPQHLSALRLRALTRISLGDHLAAVDDLNAYLALEPQDASALADRAVAKKFLEDYRGSLADLSQAEELQPHAVESLWGHKALAQEMLGDHETALESSEKAIEENPNDFSAHLARGRAAIILGLPEQAEPSLDWLVQKYPQSGYYLWLRGECRCGIKEDERCLQDLESATLLEKDSPILAERLAFHYYHRIHQPHQPPSTEELRQSKKYYEQAAALGPLTLENRVNRTDTILSLAEHLSRIGRSKEAQKLAREASAKCDAILKKEPHNKRVRQFRKRIQKL